jgi:hypothetical protein
VINTFFSPSVDRFLPRSRCLDAEASVSGFPIDARALFLSCFLLMCFGSNSWTMYISVMLSNGKGSSPN